MNFATKCMASSGTSFDKEELSQTKDEASDERPQNSVSFNSICSPISPNRSMDQSMRFCFEDVDRLFSENSVDNCAANQPKDTSFILKDIYEMSEAGHDKLFDSRLEISMKSRRREIKLEHKFCNVTKQEKMAGLMLSNAEFDKTS